MKITISDGGALRDLSKALKTLGDGKQIRAELTKTLRGEVTPIVGAVQAAYRANPSRTGKGRLRPALAKATRAEVRTAGKRAGVRVIVDGRRMPSGMGRIPQYYEGVLPRWRHPVFGNPDVWVAQRPQPTFYRVADPMAGPVIGRVEQAIDQTIQRTMGR
ncbi:MAG: hypothetical protein L0Y54_21020 [Sporichthyaceae bacterium]|nr:hypothetical protein [Sporichthyaceae bacterium]